MSIHTKRLQSGRNLYEVKLRSPDGRQYSRSFRTRREAEAYEVRERATQLSGAWVDPRSGAVTFGVYADEWLRNRPNLRPRTVELYEYLIRRYLRPEWVDVELKAISPARVRSWHARLQRSTSIGSATVAKAYRLMRTIMATAVEDEILGRNPCLVKGASVEKAAERPVATLEQVAALAGAIDGRYRALVLLATWGGLRYGELAGLARAAIDVDAGTVRVTRQLQELVGGQLDFGPPKTDAARRLVAIPPHIVPELAAHLATYVGPGADDLVFTSPDGTPLRRSNFQPALLAARLCRRRDHRVSLPRPPPHREHARRLHRGQHQGADEPHGARQPPCRADLPARHRTAGPGPR